MSKKERIILLLLSAINFTHILDFMIMMPLGNFLIPYFGISAQQFSLIVASYTLSAGTVGFLAAFFVDRFDRKRVLLTGYTGFIVGTICCGIAPTYELLLASRILAGAFGGLIGAQVLSIVADIFIYERRGVAMGAIMSAFSVASVFGVPFGLYLANHISWHAPFILVGILGIFIIVLVARYLPPMNTHIRAKDDSGRVQQMVRVVKQIASDKAQLNALALSASLMMGHFMIVPFINPYMEFNVGFTKDQTPLIYLVGGTLTFFSSPLIGRIADKKGKMQVFRFFVLTSILPVFLITNMPPIPFYFVLMVTGIWFVLSTGRGIPAQAMISNVVPSEQRGSFMSFNTSVQQLFTGMASLIAGWIVTVDAEGKIHNYQWVGYISIAIVFSCLFTAGFLNKRILEKQAVEKETAAVASAEQHPEAS
jgi:DHA1 family inner membrane transport protein